jgi:hypothetical protein
VLERPRGQFIVSVKLVMACSVRPRCLGLWPLTRGMGSKVMTAWGRVLNLPVGEAAEASWRRSVVANGTGELG